MPTSATRYARPPRPCSASCSNWACCAQVSALPGAGPGERRPWTGQDALDAWRHSYQAVKAGAGEEADLALAVAIWGLRTLWNTRLRDIIEAISPTSYSTD